jgi:hypothetical protein
MTDCADSTLLRVHLDHPDGVLEAHLDTCDACAGLLRSVAEDAGVARVALARLDPAGSDPAPTGADVEAALAAVLARADLDRTDLDRSDPGATPVPVTTARRRFRPSRRSGHAGGSRRSGHADGSRRSGHAGRRLVLPGAAAVLIVVTALTPAGRGAVAGVLDVFRGTRLQPVAVDATAWAASFGPDDARALEALGTVDTSRLSEPDEVADAAAAEATAGIRAPKVTERPDRYVAMAPGTARLTLVAKPGNGVPAELDGATLLVDVPGAIGAVYGPAAGPSGRGSGEVGPSGRGSGEVGPSGRGSGEVGPSGRGSGQDRPSGRASGKLDAPRLVVGHTGPLVIRAEGAPLETVRSFVLSREELPADLRAQLAAIGDWRSTIPVPVPRGGPGWDETEVAGRPAIAFGDDSGVGAFVVRQDPDGVTVVGGRIGVSRALDLAAGA